MKKDNLITLLWITIAASLVVAVASVPSIPNNPPTETDTDIEKRFEKIYIEIQKTGEYIYGLGDTAVRNTHYSKPHTTYQDLCPECADLWGKKKEGIVEIPLERLEELRSLSSPSQPDQAQRDEPAKTPTTEEELDLILLLLKQQQGHIYTNKYTAEIQYHYLKKHKHPHPGIEGGCPDCIALRKKQTTETRFISKQEHEKLLKSEASVGK